MTAIPLASSSAAAESTFVTGEKLVNLYAEANPQGSRSPFTLYRTPGLLIPEFISSNISRGMLVLEDEERLITVHDTAVIAVDTDINPTVISGSMPGSDDLIMARNMAATPQICMVSDAGIRQLAGTTLTTVSDSDLPSGAVSVDCLNNYGIYGFADGRMFSSSANNFSAIDPLDFATAESSPDGLVRAKVFRNELFAMGVTTIEPWKYDASSAAFPFIAVPGATIPVGLINKHAVVDHAGQMVWVDHLCVARRLQNGYGAERISNAYVERKLQAADKDQIKVFGYSQGGHQFFVFRAPTMTCVFDATTGLWHDRKTHRRDCWQAKNYAFFNSRHFVSRDNAGDLLELSNSVFQEDGQHLVAEFTMPPVSNFPNGGIIDQLTFDVECGTGADSSEPDEDQEPELMLEWSIDGGKNWKAGRRDSLGPRGNRREQVQFNRLGEFGRQGVQFRVACSANVALTFVASDIRVRERRA